MTAHGLDSRQFRTALGAFATGVTIVTTLTADGTPVGLTANSFNSLSLQPPMVLWALAKTSKSLAAFIPAEYFAVHVLAADQQALASLFATRGADKFGDVDWDSGRGGVPLLRACSARFQCRAAHQYEGGDHVIFVGEVVEFDHLDKPALAFHGGAYASLLRRPAAPAAAAGRGESLDASFSRDFLGYMLASAHSRLMALVRGELERYQLAEEHYHVLMFLSAEDNLTIGELTALTQVADRVVTYDTIAALAIRDLVVIAGGNYPSTRIGLTADGHRVALELGAALKAAEVHAERFLGANDAQALKILLRAIIDAIPPAAPEPPRFEH